MWDPASLDLRGGCERRAEGGGPNMMDRRLASKEAVEDGVSGCEDLLKCSLRNEMISAARKAQDEFWYRFLYEPWRYCTA